MIRHRGMDLVTPQRFVRPVVSIGVFDGVHLGHRRVLREVIDWAARIDGQSVVITFDRHPQAILKEDRPLFITSLEHRLRQFEMMGIDHCIVLTFDASLAATPAEPFLRDTILGAIGSHRIVLGYNAAFGKDGEGNYDFLKKLEGRYDLEVRRVEPVEVEGRRVSSTIIRREILDGHLAVAAKMLGRPISVLGTVVKGTGRGRRIGYPTINLDLHHELRPPTGVYITTVRIGERIFRSLTNIGYRPTFASEYDADHGRELVETHVPGFSEEIYGWDVEVSFLEKIREEKKFDSEEALAARLAQDLALLRAYNRSERGLQ